MSNKMFFLFGEICLEYTDLIFKRIVRRRGWTDSPSLKQVRPVCSSDRGSRVSVLFCRICL